MSHRCVGQGMRKGFSGVPSGPAITHYVIQRCLAPRFLSCSRVLCVAKKKFSLVSPLLSSSLHAHTCSSVYLLASENRVWEYGYFLGELPRISEMVFGLLLFISISSSCSSFSLSFSLPLTELQSEISLFNRSNICVYVFNQLLEELLLNQNVCTFYNMPLFPKLPFEMA